MGRTHVHFATGPPLTDSLRRGADAGTTAETPPVQDRPESDDAAAIVLEPDARKDPTGPDADADTNAEAEVVRSGMRKDAQILIYLDIRRALTSGLDFWLSENGVVLCEGSRGIGDSTKGGLIPIEFFDVVVERAEGLGVIFEGRKEVQALPPRLVKKGMPFGKQRGEDGEREGGGGKKGRGRGRGKPRLGRVEKGSEDVDGDVGEGDD